MIRLTLTFLALLVPAITVAQGAAGKENPPNAATLFERAVERHQAGDILGAVDAYEASLDIEPNNPEARSNLGAALVRLGRYDDAIEQYRQALATTPDNVAFRFNLGLALYKGARIPEAATELENVLARDESHLNARGVLADCYLQMGRFQEVVDLLLPWEERFGDDRAFAYLLGSAFIETDWPDEGQRVIDRIFRGGDSAEGRLLMATAYMKGKQHRAALEELRKAAELNPRMPLVHTLMGRALMRSGDQAGALNAFRRELEINPNDFQANLEMGELKKREQQFDEATAYLEKALRMRPRDASARFGMAGLELSTGKTDVAHARLEEIVKETPTFVEAHVLLATVYYRLGRRADGDRERAMVERLNAEAQAKQPGAARR